MEEGELRIQQPPYFLMPLFLMIDSLFYDAVSALEAI
jgi:hypothetical protein